MGTSRNAVDLSRKFDALARGIEQRQTTAARAGAAVIGRQVTSNLRAATGGDMMLSGMSRTTTARKGARGGAKKMGVRVFPARDDGVIVKATGPVQLVENDVPPHFVVSRHAKGAQRLGTNGRRLRATRQSRIASVAFGEGAAGGGRRAVLRLSDGRFRRFTIASSKGRHPWRNGVRQSRDRAARAMRIEEAKEIAKVFT